jgi:hypothetical protein
MGPPRLARWRMGPAARLGPQTVVGLPATAVVGLSETPVVGMAATLVAAAALRVGLVTRRPD